MNGEPDYGAVGTATLKNSGRRGSFNVDFTLHTSTGDIKKATTVEIDEGGTRSIEVQFTEPVITTEFQQIYAECRRG